MSARELFDPEAETEVRSGREYPYATLGHWVLLIPPLSDRAVRIYGIFRMHINRKAGDGKCWPGQDLIAELLGLAKPDAVAGAIGELVTIGAIDKPETVATVNGRRNVYTVHEAPPDGYEGPTTQLHYKVMTGREEPKPGYVGPPPGWSFPAKPWPKR